MAASSGIAPLASYAGAANDAARVQLLIDLIPDVDTTSSSGSQAGGGYLDQMSPAAAVQLRVELAALKAAVS
jgi:hypothetical protein